MSFLDKIRFKRESRATEKEGQSAASSARGAGLTAYTAGSFSRGAVPADTPGTAMRVSAVYRAVAVLSDSVGRLPLVFKIYSAREHRFVPYLSTEDGRRMNRLLTVGPNRRMSAFEFFKNIVKQMLLEGNAYVYPRRNGLGDVESLVLLSPGSVVYDRFSDTYFVADPVNGVSGTFGGGEMIHVRNESLDGGYTGVSTLYYAEEVLSAAATGDKELLDRFANGGRFKALVGNDTSVQGWGQYQDDQLDSVRDLLQAQINAGRDIISTRGDVKVHPLNMSASDMQFTESMKQVQREVACFFGVPPVYLMDDTNVNYKSGEMASVQFLNNGLSPLLSKIEQEFLCKLVPLEVRDRFRFSFDTDALFITDLSTRGNWMRTQIETGTATPNELRRRLDQPPVEGGDRAFVSTNLTSLDGAGRQGAAQPDGAANEEEEKEA